MKFLFFKLCFGFNFFQWNMQNSLVFTPLCFEIRNGFQVNVSIGSKVKVDIQNNSSQILQRVEGIAYFFNNRRIVLGEKMVPYIQYIFQSYEYRNSFEHDGCILSVKNGVSAVSTDNLYITLSDNNVKMQTLNSSDRFELEVTDSEITSKSYTLYEIRHVQEALKAMNISATTNLNSINLKLSSCMNYVYNAKFSVFSISLGNKNIHYRHDEHGLQEYYRNTTLKSSKHGDEVHFDEFNETYIYRNRFNELYVHGITFSYKDGGFEIRRVLPQSHYALFIADEVSYHEGILF